MELPTNRKDCKHSGNYNHKYIYKNYEETFFDEYRKHLSLEFENWYSSINSLELENHLEKERLKKLQENRDQKINQILNDTHNTN